MTMSKSTQATAPDQKPIIVVKMGGSIIDQLTQEFYDSFSELLDHYHCIIVHGGGPAITSLLSRLEIEGEFHNGLRKTDEKTLEVVEMTLGGKVNAQITTALLKQGIKALGIKGSDASLITAVYEDQENLGFVGKVENVDAGILYQCLNADYLPVVAPLGKTKEGQTVNINADTTAGAIAQAVKAEKLLFVTDVPGILRDEKVIEQSTPQEIQSLIDHGWIYGGMIPKVQSAIEALSDQLQEVMIVSGKQAIIQGNHMKGTKIRSKRKEGVE
jgi:acetylglutamate kinase